MKNLIPNSIRIVENNSASKVFINENLVGILKTHFNKYYSRNVYIDFDFSDYDFSSEILFVYLREKFNRPLQIMINSDEKEKINFIINGGFRLRRRCFEVAITREQFKNYNPQNDCNINCCTENTEKFLDCNRFMYAYHIETHENINPLTASFEEFCEILPQTAFYTMQNGKIVHCAFCENNEIAYLATSDGKTFPDFAYMLLKKLFLDYETVCAECDDCDCATTILKDTFSHKDSVSFDTYILDEK